MHCLCVPSIEEGFARVITEAMAAGLPVIASHESGATTLVETGWKASSSVRVTRSRLRTPC